MALLWLLSCVTLIGTRVGSGAPAGDPELSVMPRIINGVEASPGSWPWHVLVQNPRRVPLCGGSLINRNWVITAATCNVTTSDFVVTGLYDRSSFDDGAQQIKITKIVRHPVMHGTFHDIALLKIAFPIRISATLSPVALPTANDRFLPGVWCNIMGWGYTQHNVSRYPEKLHQATAPLLSTDDCKMFLGRLYNDAIVCAGTNGVSSSFGDSGSPLVCRKYGVWTLVGILSRHNIKNPTTKPFVATRVTTFIPWIMNTMCLN